MKTLSLVLVSFLMSTTAAAAEPVSLIERIETDLAKDKAFTLEERQTYAREFRRQLGAYAFDVLKQDGHKAADVLMTIVTEGSFDQVAIERTVAIAAGAYVAMSRGAPPNIVEGVALYGFLKKLNPDRIATWANGANDLIRFGVPKEVAREVVYVAAEQDWDVESFNNLKWGLVQAVIAAHVGLGAEGPNYLLPGIVYSSILALRSCAWKQMGNWGS